MSLAARIEARAALSGIRLEAGVADRLAAHARLVLVANPLLHLTTITGLEELVERHVGESLDGAAMLDPLVSGTLVDLGSGNGYPGIPVALVRPGLRPVLAESSAKKAAFLRDALAAIPLAGSVLERSVQHASDLADVAPVDVLVSRAAGRWETIVPKLADAIRPGGAILLWAGASSREVIARASWRKLEPGRTHAIPGRTASFVHLLHRK